MDEQTKTAQTAQATQANKAKEEGKPREALKTMGKIIIGGTLIILGLLAVITWWSNLWAVFKGCVGLFLILAGAITIAIAKE